MYSLNRFLEAQENCYSIALQELQAGEKRSHWMWFIFPQLRGLGRSTMAHFYGIDGVEEAKAYLSHPILSARLDEASRALLMHRGKNVVQIMGQTDAMKLRSSMTLFALLSPDNSVYHQVLACFYQGCMDPLTQSMLS